MYPTMGRLLFTTCSFAFDSVNIRLNIGDDFKGAKEMQSSEDIAFLRQDTTRTAGEVAAFAAAPTSASTHADVDIIHGSAEASHARRVSDAAAPDMEPSFRLSKCTQKQLEYRVLVRSRPCLFRSIMPFKLLTSAVQKTFIAFLELLEGRSFS